MFPANKTLLFLTATDCRYHPELGAFYLAHLHSDIDRALHPPLVQLFHHVVRYDVHAQYVQNGAVATNRQILELGLAHRPSYVLWYSLDRRFEVFPSTCSRLRELGSTVIVIFTDDDGSLEEHANWYAPNVDYCVSLTRRDAQRVYQLCGSHGLFWPNGADPDVYRRLGVQFRYDVSFVGTRNPDRQRKLAALEDSGIRIEKFGIPWTPFLPVESINEIFNTSRINLNFTGFHLTPAIKQMKGRIFEICMAGGFLLTEYVEGIEEYFDVGKEIACFSTFREASDLIRYYLDHEEIRTAMALRAYDRSRRQYTWASRLEWLFRQLPERGQPVIGAVGWASHVRPRCARNDVASRFHRDWAIALLCSTGEKERSLDELRLANLAFPRLPISVVIWVLQRMPISVTYPIAARLLSARRLLQKITRILAQKVVALQPSTRWTK